MTMRATYSTNVSYEVLEEIIKRLKENGLKVEQSAFNDSLFVIGNGDHRVIAVVVNGTVYVNKLGSCIPRLLEKNEIPFSFSQHAKVPLAVVEHIFQLEESL